MNKNKDEINDEEFVTAYKYGKSLEMSNVIGGTPSTVWYDKDHMIKLETGELIEIEHATSRADPRVRASLKVSFKKLKRLIGANFNGGSDQLWVTLTYRWQTINGKKVPMTDSKKLYYDFGNFIKRLRIFTNKQLMYIVCIEPQASGAWHAHCLIKTPDKSPLFVTNKDMYNCWKQGFVNVKRIKQSDNIAAYLVAYLTDIDVNDANGNHEMQSTKTPKNIIKGGRLGFYPLNFQLFRRSKGIRDPEKVKGKCKQIKAKYGVADKSPDYYRELNIQHNSDNVPFKIKTEYFDLRDKELKDAIAKIKDKTKKTKK